MLKKTIYFIAFILLLSNNLFPYRFLFKDKKGDRYVINTHTDQEILINNVTAIRMDMRHKGELTVTAEIPGAVTIKGKYDYYERPIGDSGAYRATNTRSYETEFNRTPLGKMTVAEQYYYPVTRNVPLFPERDLSIGDTWEAEGEESQDFRKRGIPNPYKYKTRVFYKYAGDVERDGETHAIIEFLYYVNERTPHTIQFGAPDGLIPARFFGVVKGKYFWNKKKNFTSYYESEYNFYFVNKNGTTNEFKGIDKGEIKKVPIITRDDENEIVTRLNRDIQQRQIPAEVTRNDRGVAVNFQGKVLFAFSSYELTEEAKARLKKIAEMLKELIKKHPGIEFRIEGHSDSIGRADRKQLFSDRRAQAVANFLIQEGVDASRISFRGFADTRPIAPNDTAEGRERNRRVEIIIQTR